jgi:trehalose utilization protein
MVRVTVWNEYRHEREDNEITEVYPDGIHGAIAQGLQERGHEVQTATLDEPDHGLTEDVLQKTDVLTWWGHSAHDEVHDNIVDRVQEHVLEGMGFIPLHSAHYAKPFKRLMGTSCSLKWRGEGETERLWTVERGHPITKGLDEYIEIPQAEMFGERFDIPQPDSLVFISWFEGGEVFRSGCCYNRGKGRVFYFRPGHETFPVFHQNEVLDILDNAVKWAAPVDGPPNNFTYAQPLEPLD